MHKFLFLLFFACLTIQSCSEIRKKRAKVETVPSRDWNEIKKDSVLVVLAENSPVSYFIYRGRNMGYEYELLHEFAKDKDIRLQIRMVNDLDEMLNLLDNKEGDIIACNLTITEERQAYLAFTEPHLISHQVLIQRKPENHKELNKKELQDTLIQNIEELSGKKVHVWKNSSYFSHLELLNKQLNLSINIAPTDGDLITAELIRMVSIGLIDYTIADENVAKIDLNYYPNLDISLKLSDDQALGFATRKDSPELINELNEWLLAKENRSTIAEVKRKYFTRKNLTRKANSNYSSLSGNILSPYDEIIKSESEKIGWDWRLISAVIYQESKFETWKTSWAGAFGIFQFMPATAISYGIDTSSSTESQLRAGIRKLNKNYRQWQKVISDSLECIKFTLATYNAGRGHIDDGRRLARKHNLKDSIWDDNVAIMVKNLSHPKYYGDKIVRAGYCRGIETFEYVTEIMQRYEEYKSAFPDISKK
ncbi:MltF family protein [Crocinitomix catalasitica]|uniref:transporter substrate-binding domain-containing protein n=1 Tax=Crocinitomix catalasitica TaxID=184607 RepID=UPI00056B1FFA|nr:transporter substrate-binding domain-containing protein [Crocinitomix catalasitica]